MPRVRRTVAAVLLLVAACTPSVTPGGPASQPASTPAPTVPPATTTPTAAATPFVPPVFSRNPAAYVEGAPYAPVIDPDASVEGITHPFLPFTPGARWVYGGAERIVVEVLDETKDILGIKATVVRDRVYEDGELIEDTLD